MKYVLGVGAPNLKPHEFAELLRSIADTIEREKVMQRFDGRVLGALPHHPTFTSPWMLKIFDDDYQEE